MSTPPSNRRLLSDAELCRANGWTPGTVLEGRETVGRWWAESQVRITAIGEQLVLARELKWRTSEDPEWKPVQRSETRWTFYERNWRVIESEDTTP